MVRENNINTISCVVRREVSTICHHQVIQLSLDLIRLSTGHNAIGFRVRMFTCLRVASLWIGVSDNPCNPIRLQNLDIPCISGRSKCMLYVQLATNESKDPTEVQLSAQSSSALPHHDGPLDVIVRAQKHKRSRPSRLYRDLHSVIPSTASCLIRL